MKLPKKIILPLTVIAMVSACAPYPPLYPYGSGPAATTPPVTEQQTILDVKKQEEKAQTAATPKPKYELPTTPVAPAKTYYPTATKVPGKEGFVYNPYTQSYVNVKGIASGKLVRDPEESDTTHKFRVP